MTKVPFDTWWRVIMEHRYDGMTGTFIHPVSDPAVIAGDSVSSSRFQLMDPFLPQSFSLLLFRPDVLIYAVGYEALKTKLSESHFFVDHQL